MKKFFVCFFYALIICLVCNAQDDPNVDGHKLAWIQNNIKVYRSNANTPDLSNYKYWEFKYWFYTDEIVKGSDGNDYIKILIPNTKGPYIEEVAAWTGGVSYIDNGDFDKWLFISKKDFDAFKRDHYKKYKISFVASGLTVPFKIHPARGAHESSLMNAEFAAGTFLGISFGIKDIRLSLGGMLGFASLGQNSSNNSAITGADSETMMALNYGFGFVIDVSKKFQLGGVLGFDHGYGDKNSGYIYQNKSWFAISLNFNFLSTSKPTENKSQN